MAIEAVFRELITEGDNAGVMQSLHFPRPHRSRLGYFLFEIQVTYLILDMVLSHATPCTGNMVAHSLASLWQKS